MNGNPSALPSGSLSIEKSVMSSSDRGNIWDLFRSPDRSWSWFQTRLTLMVGTLFFTIECLYYGIVLISTEMLNSESDICQRGSSRGVHTNSTSNLNCQ